MNKTLKGAINGEDMAPGLDAPPFGALLLRVQLKEEEVAFVGVVSQVAMHPDVSAEEAMFPNLVDPVDRTFC